MLTIVATPSQIQASRLINAYFRDFEYTKHQNKCKKIVPLIIIVTMYNFNALYTENTRCKMKQVPIVLSAVNNIHVCFSLSAHYNRDSVELKYIHTVKHSRESQHQLVNFIRVRVNIEESITRAPYLPIQLYNLCKIHNTSEVVEHKSNQIDYRNNTKTVIASFCKNGKELKKLPNDRLHCRLQNQLKRNASQSANVNSIRKGVANNYLQIFGLAGIIPNKTSIMETSFVM